MTGCLIKRMAGRQDLEQDVSRSQNLRDGRTFGYKDGRRQYGWMEELKGDSIVGRCQRTIER